VFKFIHTLQMDWLLPGVAPTNKPVEVVKGAVRERQDRLGADPLGPGPGPRPVRPVGPGQASRRRGGRGAEGARPTTTFE
jgi:hypothetical protein